MSDARKREGSIEIKKSAGSKTASQASNVVKIDSREEQKVVNE